MSVLGATETASAAVALGSTSSGRQLRNVSLSRTEGAASKLPSTGGVVVDLHHVATSSSSAKCNAFASSGAPMAGGEALRDDDDDDAVIDADADLDARKAPEVSISRAQPSEGRPSRDDVQFKKNVYKSEASNKCMLS